MLRLMCIALTLALVSFLACTGNFGLGNNDGTDSTGNGVDSFLPDDVTLELDELPDEDDANAKAVNSDALIAGNAGRFRPIRATGAIIHAFHRAAARAMALGEQIREDMTSPDQTQVEGTFDINGVEVAYKADFAAFDIDSDGIADGSGDAVTEPVALRIWTDRGDGFAPFSCSLITTKPTDENIGAGQMFVHPDAVHADAADDLQIHILWDRTDDLHKWNEAYVSGQLRQTYSLSIGRQRVDVRTYDDESVEKTVRSSNVLSDNPFGFENAAFSVHFRRGEEFALVNADATGGVAQVSVTDACVDLSTGALATGGECDDFDTQDVELLDAPLGDEADFPAGFAAEPTF